MLLEASRLGASVRGVDIEPVAAAIARFQTTLRDLPDLASPLEHLIETVGCELAPFYRAEDAEGRPETLLHAFWVQQVRCSGCGFTFDAHPKFRLAWSHADSKQWVACRDCSSVIEAALDDVAVKCSCGAETPSAGGHVDRGEAGLSPVRSPGTAHRIWPPDGGAAEVPIVRCRDASRWGCAESARS